MGFLRLIMMSNRPVTIVIIVYSTTSTILLPEPDPSLLRDFTANW